MTSLDFNDCSSLGIGAESFFMMEEEAPEAEAEVKLNVQSSEDQQLDSDADVAASDSEVVSDKGAELFKDVARLANIEKVLTKHELHPSLYAFLNADGQLDKLLRTQLPGVESLSTTSGNVETINTILPKLETLFKSSIDGNIKKFYEIVSAKMKKMQVATDKVVANRAKRVAEMIARLEQDEAPEETAVTTEDAPAESDEAPAPEAGAGDAEPQTPAEAEVADDTSSEGEEAPASTEPVEVDANTAEETNFLMKAVSVTDIKNTPIFIKMDAAIAGDTEAMSAITDHVRNGMKALSKYRQLSHTGRRIVYKKQSVLEGLRTLKTELSNWSNVNMLHYACQNLTKSGRSATVTGYESFNKILPSYKAMTVMQNYLQVSKKVMDAAYFNLSFAAHKLLARRCK